MKTDQDKIQKQINDLELISAGYDQLLRRVLEDREWRKSLAFIEDLELSVRKRQKEIMEELNTLVRQRERKNA